MRVIARTGRNTGVSAGPLGLLVLAAIGGLIALVLAAVVVLAASISAAGAMLVAGELRRRRV